MRAPPMLAVILMVLVIAGCGYREAPTEVRFRGRTYERKAKGNWEFVDRNLYFLPGEDMGTRTTSVDLSRIFDKKRTEKQMHDILAAGLRRAVVKVLHEREEGTRHCVVYEETPGRFYVSYHVTGNYKHGYWSTDFCRAVTAAEANATACDDAPTTWADLLRLGDELH